jgi:hypothetical protein
MVSGVVEGTSASEALEAAESPWLLFALTVQVYEMPFVNPLTETGDTDPLTTTDPQVASYPESVDPRRSGVPKVSVICPDPATAEAIEGASGVSWATAVVLDAEANAVHASLTEAA